MKQLVDNGLRPAPGGQDGVGSPHTERTLSARLRGLLALAMCVCLTLPLIPAPAQAAETPATSWTDANNYDTGWYTDNSSSFTISTAAELAGLAKLSESNNFSGKTVTLTADVDLSTHLWPGIDGFQGTFHGGNHTISGVTMDKTATQETNGHAFAGFFESIVSTGSIVGVRLSEPHFKLTGSTLYCGGIVSNIESMEVKDCVVERPVFELTLEGDTRKFLVGGLVGRAVGRGYSVYNSAVSDLSVTVIGSPTEESWIGGLGGAAFSNCVATVKSITKGANVKFSYTTHSLAAAGAIQEGSATNCYWLPNADIVEDAGALDNKHSCYPVTEEQVKGISSKPIAAGDTYASTPSLATAMNSWIAANGGTGAKKTWTADELAALLPIHYLDISGPLDEVTHQSATGDIQTGMDLEGQIQENVTLLSVTLPASIPFIVDVDGGGAFKRVLSATGTLTNRSDCGVNITLTAVTDAGNLLDKVALSLVPDPAPSVDKPQIALTKGAGKTDLLAALAAPAADGTPTTATLKVDGAAKSGAAPIGSDGDAFVVGLTLKVSKK